MARSKVLTQEKHYEGNLPPKEVEDLIQKLRYQFEHCYVPSEVDGFLIIGGDGLSAKSQKLVDDFASWASAKECSLDTTQVKRWLKLEILCEIEQKTSGSSSNLWHNKALKSDS